MNHLILKRFFSKFFSQSRDLVVGQFTYGHKSIILRTWEEDSRLIIGKYCSIAKNVTVFLGGNHNSDWISTFPFGHTSQSTFGKTKYKGHPSTNGDVRIGNDVWIGSGSTIMSGVTIGDGAIIAANSHVVKRVPDYEIWGGNPARFIKKRFDDELIQELLNLRWWDYPITKVSQVKHLLNSEVSLTSLELVKRKLAN